MSAQGEFELKWTATSNASDRPLVVYGYEDGSWLMRRDYDEPRPGWISRSVVPHATLAPIEPVEKPHS